MRTGCLIKHIHLKVHYFPFPALLKDAPEHERRAHNGCYFIFLGWQLIGTCPNRSCYSERVVSVRVQSLFVIRAVLVPSSQASLMWSCVGGRQLCVLCCQLTSAVSCHRSLLTRQSPLEQPMAETSLTHRGKILANLFLFSVSADFHSSFEQPKEHPKLI